MRRLAWSRLRRTAAAAHGPPGPDDGAESERPIVGSAAASIAVSPVLGQLLDGAPGAAARAHAVWLRARRWALTFAKFVGPGFMISVAYIDPGNYSTDIAAGATYQFRLLFIILLSNLFAILLQSLAIQLGTVTGLDLASMCRVHLPRWLNWFLYALAELAIIATDIAEVIGTAIALNLLVPQLPLVAGCALSILDVMAILFFYRPEGAVNSLRLFEAFVSLLVIGVVVCFCIQLSMIRDTSVGDIFRGYLPSAVLVESQGLYQACGILGATVMPHSLYLGSGIVQPRLREFDVQNGLLSADAVSAMATTPSADDGYDKATYVPSHAAIRFSLKHSIVELTLSLFTFALFVNSAILIVAGASLYQLPDAVDADIFKIHDLLSRSISDGVGTIFALALLLSGVSAGIVCTIAGQMVSEGALRWRIRPWLRRLVTRSISITPSIVVAGTVGREGLNAALNASQVVLSVVLPFVTLPLIYFTSRRHYMTTRPGMARYVHYPACHQEEEEEEEEEEPWPADSIDMSSAWWLIVLAAIVWGIMATMNIANLVLLGLGKS